MVQGHLTQLLLHISSSRQDQLQDKTGPPRPRQDQDRTQDQDKDQVQDHDHDQDKISWVLDAGRWVVDVGSKIKSKEEALPSLIQTGEGSSLDLNLAC